MKRKTAIISILSLLMLITLVAPPLQAGGWTIWTWKIYKLKFNLPSNWKVGRNDRAQFYAYEPAGMSVRITPWKDKRYNAKQVANNGWSRLSAIQNKKVYKRGSLGKHNGFDIHLILGTGTQKGKRVRFAMLGCINPRSPVNVIMRLTWWDKGASYNKQKENIAKAIAKTLKAY